MAHGYSAGWTYRQGRTYYQPGERRTGGGMLGGCCAAIFCSVFLIAIPIMAWNAEMAYHDMLVAFDEVKDHIIMCDGASAADISSCAPKSSLVHLSSDSVSGSAEDPDFGVSVSGALELHRNVEYCQWQETKHERCETCTREGSNGEQEKYSCNCVTTYSYIKGWRSHRIMSVFFDQPAAHNNPQRDPYPGNAFPSMNARVGSTPLLPELIANPHGAFRAASRRVEWTRGAVREPQWYDFILKFFRFRLGGSTRYEEVENLRGAERSEAARRHNFVYVGRGGYFFSPYEASQYEQLFKYFVEFLEGSLFDWQVGDVMPSCTAGDIRVSYSVADPQEVSVVAGVVEGRAGAALGLFRTSSDYELGIVHEGFTGAYDMFDREAWEGKKWCLLCRALLFPCCWAFAHAIAAFCGLRFDDWKATGAAAVEGVLVSVMWSLIWRFQFASFAQHAAMVVLGFVSVGLGSVALKRTQPNGYGSGGGSFVEWFRDTFGIRPAPPPAPEPAAEASGKQD